MPRRPREAAARQAGFTLIEVLAALVVTALLVAVAIPYATRMIARWSRGEATVASADAWMQAAARMSQDLAEAVPVGLGPGRLPPPAFRASRDAITFVRHALAAPDALETVIFAVVPSAAGNALVRRSRPFDRSGFAADAGGAAAILLDGPARLRLVEIDADGTRHLGWSPIDGMPAAVELSVVAGGRDAGPVVPILMPVIARDIAAR